jgi:glycosyltransferase involved in cell wall biosynthesis
MRISIITVCLNSEKTILHSLNSVVSQNYKNIEHILVDGGSNDKTISILKKYKFKNKKIIFTKGESLYESLNIGIKKSTGDLISILHSDDIYNSHNTLSKVAKYAKNSKQKIFFGNVIYFNKKNFSKVIRYYPAFGFKKEKLIYGNMPPHTGSFYKKEIFKKYGYYDKSYKIAGDFEHLLRLIYIKKIKFKILNFVITRMRTGGLSSKNINSFIIINNEIIKSFKTHYINSNFFNILLRIPSKIIQYFFLDQKKLNIEFFLKISKEFDHQLFNRLNIIENIKNINFKKNFILSALNLAFLGSLAKGEIKLDKNLINWPDGVFSKLIQKRIKKIPGRQVLSDLQITNDIKRIIIMGNLSKISKDYLKLKYKKIPIIHKVLPFGSIDKITKKINLKIKNSDLIFLTLPTPKQEQIAQYLKSKNKYFKIICIGGSIGIVSGDEKEVPKFLYYFEFLWRLRYETRRRLNRLLVTFYQYISDILIGKRLKDITIKIIK